MATLVVKEQQNKSTNEMGWWTVKNYRLWKSEFTKNRQNYRNASKTYVLIKLESSRKENVTNAVESLIILWRTKVYTLYTSLSYHVYYRLIKHFVLTTVLKTMLKTKFYNFFWDNLLKLISLVVIFFLINEVNINHS